MNNRSKPREISRTTLSGAGPSSAAGPHGLALLPLAGWRWMLETGIGMTALTLGMLRAQRSALNGAAPDAASDMAPAGARLTVGDIFERMAAAGYREISEIEWEDDHYEVEARDPDGQAVELQVTGHSGAVEQIEPRD